MDENAGSRNPRSRKKNEQEEEAAGLGALFGANDPAAKTKPRKSGGSKEREVSEEEAAAGLGAIFGDDEPKQMRPTSGIEGRGDEGHQQVHWNPRMRRAKALRLVADAGNQGIDHSALVGKLAF